MSIIYRKNIKIKELYKLEEIFECEDDISE